jgi:hypothetical protein
MGVLEVRREQGGLRNYVDGEEVHAGDVLEMLIADGTWITGRYEWTHSEDERPAFYTGEPGPDEGVLIFAGDVLRRPGRD